MSFAILQSNVQTNTVIHKYYVDVQTIFTDSTVEKIIEFTLILMRYQVVSGSYAYFVSKKKLHLYADVNA